MIGTESAFDSDEKKGKYVLNDELAKQTDDPITLRHEDMNILMAGRDTTASLLSNLFVILAKHPHVWTKLRHELLELNGNIPDDETLSGMKYLKYVLNEGRPNSSLLYTTLNNPTTQLTLPPRIPPPLPLRPTNYRQANKPTPLPRGGGTNGLSAIFIPAGALV